HRWAKGVEANILAVALAQHAAVSADMVFEFMGLVRRGVVDDRLPPRPDCDRWLRLYGEHRLLTLAVGDAAPEVLGTGAVLQGMLDRTRALGVWAKNEPDEVKRWLEEDVGRHQLGRWVRFGVKAGHRRYRRHLREMGALLRDEHLDDDAEFGARLASSPELYFYLRVVLPCMCAHARLPIML